MRQVLAGVLAVGAIALQGMGTANAEPLDHYAFEVGDDNGDGVITEDESGWSCVDDGNQICGPGNSDGVPAGCYDVGGVLLADWPCN